MMDHTSNCGLDPVRFKDPFHLVYWKGANARIGEIKAKKRLRQWKDKEVGHVNLNLHAALANTPSLLGNPTYFAVFCNVRQTVSNRLPHILKILNFKELDSLGDAKNKEAVTSNLTAQRLPQTVSVGVRALCDIIAGTKETNPDVCTKSLHAIRNMLQSYHPEIMRGEPYEVAVSLYSILLDIANSLPAPSSQPEDGIHMTAAAAANLLAMGIGTGETEFLIGTVARLLTSPQELAEQQIFLPANQILLQRAVQARVLGTSTRNYWIHRGVTNEILTSTFNILWPSNIKRLGALEESNKLSVKCVTSDGSYLYLLTSHGMLKAGTGYNSTLKGQIYASRANIFKSEGDIWLLFCHDNLYIKVGRNRSNFYQIDKNTFEVKCTFNLNATNWQNSTLFSDMNSIGLITITSPETMSVTFFDASNISEDCPPLQPVKEISLQLTRRRTMVFGNPDFIQDNDFTKVLEPINSMSTAEIELDPIVSICMGSEFGLLKTSNGKVFYTGRASALGLKEPDPAKHYWSPFKDRIDKRTKIREIVIGHHGNHAILITESGAALFTGLAPRGEDGDLKSARRPIRPLRLKKITKVDDKVIVTGACNYASTALVTNTGNLIIFGKDTQYCDENGVVTALAGQHITKVAMGRAHIVTLNKKGNVCTFGINNRGQCGRFTVKRDSKSQVIAHVWNYTKAIICWQCRLCSDDSDKCDGRKGTLVTGQPCYCHRYGTICKNCHICVDCGAFEDQKHCIGRVPKCYSVRGNDATAMYALQDVAAGRDLLHYAQVHKELQRDDDGNTEDDEEQQYQSGDRDHNHYGDSERVRFVNLPPARLKLNEKVVQISCGLQHTIMLTRSGKVMTFGMNHMGQLGVGDEEPHFGIYTLKLPKAKSVAAGNNHSVVLTEEGEVYTTGRLMSSMHKPESGDPPNQDWLPGKVAQLGAIYSCKATWIGASSNQTYIHIHQSIVKPEVLLTSSISASGNTIAIFSKKKDPAFKCLMINKNGGQCQAFCNAKQVDFSNTVTCMDPLYDVLWSYDKEKCVINCYDIMTKDREYLNKCSDIDPSTDHFQFNLNNGDFSNNEMMRWKLCIDVTNVELFETLAAEAMPIAIKADVVTPTTRSIFHSDLAVPSVPGVLVTRFHAALNLLALVDALMYTTKCNFPSFRDDTWMPHGNSPYNDFHIVDRFEKSGGGWGYTSTSVEAIRFSCSTDINLGGIGLYGGRGDYKATIKIFDLHTEGDDESDGELIVDMENFSYKCSPNEKYSAIFEQSVPIMAKNWYLAWVRITGPSSECGSEGKSAVIKGDIMFNFKTSKKSNNGTDVHAGQIPLFLYTLVKERFPPSVEKKEAENVCVLTKNFARAVTPSVFNSLTYVLQWTWNHYKLLLIQFQPDCQRSKLQKFISQMDKSVYIIRASLRLIKTYVSDTFSTQPTKKKGIEYNVFAECLADIRGVLHHIQSDSVPGERRKNGSMEWPIWHAERTGTIMQECHDTIITCFHAFYPTSAHKWNHFCSLLKFVKDGIIDANYERQLISTTVALCRTSARRDILHYSMPAHQIDAALQAILEPSASVNNKDINDSPDGDIAMRNITTQQENPSTSGKPLLWPTPSSSKQNPPLRRPKIKSLNHEDWRLLDVLPTLLDMVTLPTKNQLSQEPNETHEDCNQDVMKYISRLLARIISDLSHTIATNGHDCDKIGGMTYMTTPHRFTRKSPVKSWNVGNGTPDAIGFQVDRSGIALIGVAVYGGLSHYQYEMELLQDVVNRFGDEGSSHTWVSIDVAQGQFTTSDAYNDISHLKFDRPLHLKAHVQYAVRIRSQGGRTSNGDCGLSSVRGPDGTTFQFTTCSLSFNGTNRERGQIPYLIYFGSKPSAVVNAAPGSCVDTVLLSIRNITIEMATMITNRCCDILNSLKSQYDKNNSKQILPTIESSPCFSTLLPQTLTSLSLMGDSSTCIQVLELVHKVLPLVTALQQYVPVTETKIEENVHYSWVESEHPYKEASVTRQRVVFPPSVTWMVVEMDPRCGTAQPEDSLQIFAASIPSSRCHGHFDGTKKKEREMDIPPLDLSYSMDIPSTCSDFKCNFVPVTEKMANFSSEWPQNALIIPGHEAIFSLETATDYLRDANHSGNESYRFGYKCLVTGYEKECTFTESGWSTLESELVHAGGICVKTMLSCNLDIPPSLQDVPKNEYVSEEEDDEFIEKQDSRMQQELEPILMQGLDIALLPTVQEALNGAPLLRADSKERQFLRDLIAATPDTAGGRLAAWLYPESMVDPSKCLMCPPKDIPRVGSVVVVTVKARDQYGDAVICPVLEVTLIVKPIESLDGQILHRVANLIPVSMDGISLPKTEDHFEPLVKDKNIFQAITILKDYVPYSFEELRLTWMTSALGSGLLRIVPERMAMTTLPDGTYQGIWTPRAWGPYAIQLLVDGKESPQQLKLDVQEPLHVDLMWGVMETVPVDTPQQQVPIQLKLQRFEAVHSAGLRVRLHPSLQSEQIGIVPVDSTISYVEELVNNDGVWLRLSAECARSFCALCDMPGAGMSDILGVAPLEAWCLQYNQHTRKTLLFSLDTAVQKDKEPVWNDDPILGVPAHTTDRDVAPSTSRLDISTKLLDELYDDVEVDDEDMASDQTAVFNLESNLKDAEELVDDDYEYAEDECNSYEYDEFGDEAGQPMEIGIPEGRELQDNFINGPRNIVDAPNICEANDYDQYEVEEVAGGRHLLAYDMTYLQKRDQDENNGQEVYEQENEQQVEDIEQRYNLEDGNHHQEEEIEEEPAEEVEDFYHENNQQEEFEHNHEEEQEEGNLGEEEEEYNEEMDRDADEDESQEALKEKGQELAQENNQYFEPEFHDSYEQKVVLDDLAFANDDTSKEGIQLIESAILYDWNSTSSVNTSSNSTHPSSELPSLEDNVSVAQGESTMLIAAPTAEEHGLTADEETSPSFNDKEGSVCPLGHPIPFIKEEFKLLRKAPGLPTASNTSLSNENQKRITAVQFEGSLQSSSLASVSTSYSNRERKTAFMEDRIPFSPMRHTSKKATRNSRFPTATPTRNANFLTKDAVASTNRDSGPSPKNAQPVQNKLAASPKQLDIVRTVFAAFLWHEGIVHDAIACAAYLKFNPHLPKEGTRVVMRNNVGPNAVVNSQRHSLQVTNTGNYLQIQPSALETLTRSALKATANRSRWKRFSDVDNAISEENCPPSSIAKQSMESPTTVVDVLPPAFRALASFWDCLCTVREFELSTISKELSDVEEVEIEEDASSRDQPPGTRSQEQERCVSPPPLDNNTKILHSVWCELCGGARVQAPLAAHMRRRHPGCGALCARGYDRTGVYSNKDTTAPSGSAYKCGQYAHAFHLWYVMCSKCRDKYIREFTLRSARARRAQRPPALSARLNTYIKDNAMFLLELAPAISSVEISGDKIEATSPRFSPWLPAPPIHSLSTLGDQHLHQERVRNTPAAYKFRLHTPLAYQNMIDKDFGDDVQRRSPKNNNWLGMRFHRSVSMGPASKNVFSPEHLHSFNQCDPAESCLEGLGQPSAALQKLVSFDKNDTFSPLNAYNMNVKDLTSRPVMSFVRAKRNLRLLRDTMDSNVRISTIRKYALEAMNWMLRQSSRISSLHDIMWWFCVVLEQYRKDCDLLENSGKIDYTAIWGQGERGSILPASASALSPAGRAGAGVRDALHAFLQTVSDSMSALPSNSAALLQAVRCWALQYAPSDHTFLHSVINKILSGAEEDCEEEGAAAAPGSPRRGLAYDHDNQKEPFLLDCQDITSNVGITSSSRPAMIAALTDGSTESFWESSDENKKLPKFLSIDLPVPEPGQPKPHMICLHIDNSRDNAATVNSVTFLQRPYNVMPSSGTEIDVDPKKGTWVCFSIPPTSAFPMFVQCDLHGAPDGIVRVRQVKVLSEPIKKSAVVCSQPWTERTDQKLLPNILREYIEIETLRVFRLITSQVFGKLINSDTFNGDPSTPDGSLASTALETDETDLREHVVRILFARSQMTNLQKKVMLHIVVTIGSEARRAREFWENELRVNPGHIDSPEDVNEDLPEQVDGYRRQDNYCFEMLSLVLALSGSRAGRTHLANQAELLPDLLCLLHTGSARVQRQVIALLRRMIGQVPPNKSKLAFATGKEHSRPSISVIDVLLIYISKALSVQVKTRGQLQRGTRSARLATSVACMTASMWFVRGYTSRKHARLVVTLLQHMAEDKLGGAWGADTRKALASYPARLTTVAEEHRNADFSLSTPGLWLALGALCVVEEHFVHWENVCLSSNNEKKRPTHEKDNRPLCTNHDDSDTLAVIDCSVCGTLCQECDRFLHLSRKNRSHPRKICKEEESAIRIDIHEGCGRAKLFWLLLLVDRRSLKAVVEFRSCATADVMSTASSWSGDGGSSPNPPGFTGVCRFCGAQSDTGLLAIGNVCVDQQCQAHSRDSCVRVLQCGHTCGGARGERVCLPCLHGCASSPVEPPRPTLRQDADDMCMICFTDPISAAPAIQLTCGHVFHYLCTKKILQNKWIGPRITFSFALCAICKEPIEHEMLNELLDPIRRLEEEVRKKATMRLEYEDLMHAPAIAVRYNHDPAAFAMDRYAYYICFKCHKAYFGGEARCDAEAGWGGTFDPSELVCGACSDVTGARVCPKHGSDFLEYKCRYCCSVAAFFCFGTSHFCNACHDDFQRVTNLPESDLPHCPAGAKCTQLEGTSEDCPLHVAHPPTGQEFALGCGVCRNAHKF